MLMTHRFWGVIALPFLSKLYVRQCDVGALNAKYGWEFQTKHRLALQLVTRVVQTLQALGSKAKMRLVFDGAYAARPLIVPLLALGVSVVSRLRSNAKLFDLPEPRKAGRRGRPRKYGKNRISLSKRAGHRLGWQSISYVCRGVAVLRHYKTFLATTTILNNPNRVVILDFGNGQNAAYFSTDIDRPVQQILETVAGRWAIEEYFHDTKEIWGAGKQQVRNIWSNIACWNINGWLFTWIEWESWETHSKILVDRSKRPWDNQHCRHSHADRRHMIAQPMLGKRFFDALEPAQRTSKIETLISDLLSLAA
jgi:DDE superfamily endonuclease